MRPWNGKQQLMIGSDKRTELPSRIAVLYGGNMLATAFSGLIAAGSQLLDVPRPSRSSVLANTSQSHRVWEAMLDDHLGNGYS